MTAQVTASGASASQRIAVAVSLTLMASTGGPLSAATLGKDGTFPYNVASVPLIAEAVKLLMSVIYLLMNAVASARSSSEAKSRSLGDGSGKWPSGGGHSADSDTSACLRDSDTTQERKTTQSDSQSPFVAGSVLSLAAIGNMLREELRQVTWRSALVYFPPSMLFIFTNNLRILNMRYINPASAELLGTLRIALTAVMLRCFLRRSFTRTQWASVALLSFSVALSQMDGARFKFAEDPRVSRE